MGRVVHFEIHASNPEATVKYYTDLFGWKIAKWGDFPYWQIDTGTSDNPGINGGLVPRRGGPPQEGQPVNAFVCTVQVDSVDESVARALSLGGTIALAKMPIPGIGWLAYIKDPDGNILGVMHNDPSAH